MADNPGQRASDAEREEIADRLRAAAAEGRLDPDELDGRAGQVYSARTHGEPAEVIEDLPGFIIANVVCNAVWLATGAHTYWWPKWVLLGTGIALVVALVHAAPPGLPRL